MKFLVLIGLGLLLVSCANERIDTKSEAVSAFKSYVEAINSGSIETAAKMYDTNEGFHWIERGGVQYDAGADAAASLLSLSASGSSRMTVDTVKVAELAEGAALVSAHFDFTMLSETGQPQFSFDGWMTVGMVKRVDGWRIAGGQTGPGSID